jgi:Ca-activated chloride channel family protein
MTPDLQAWFARPVLLWTLAVVPLLALLGFLAHLARRRALALLGSALCVRKLALVRPRRRRWRIGLSLCGLLLLAIACAGPQWGQDAHQWRAPRGELAVVLDLSRSMRAEQPARQERAVRALRDLADHLQAHGGCRVALVAFASRPRLLFPLTQDYDHFRHALDQVEHDDLPPLAPGPDEPLISGTRIGLALQLAVQALTGDRPVARAILLLSDGDDPAGDREWLEGVLAAQRAQLPVHTIGLGDPQAGHTIPDRGGVLYYAGAVVKTRLDEEVLREIARRTGGTYLPARTETIPLGVLAQALLAQPRSAEETDTAGRPVPAQRYAWFLAPALALLVLTMLLADGSPVRWGRPRLPPTALAALLLALVSAAPPTANVPEFVRQGNEAFGRGQYEQALEWYIQAEELSSDPGLVAYNKAATNYRLGRFKEAELHYRRCLEDDQAPGLRRARACFDLGNALVRQADAQDVASLTQAVAAYRACLAEPAAEGDLRLDARFNLELAQLLWLQARARAPERKDPQDPSSQRKPESRPGNNNPRPGGNEEDGPPSGLPQEGAQAAGAKSGTNKVAPGPLQALPDEDELVPLAPGHAEAHLRRLAERITRERRHYHQQSRPMSGAAKDW